jgi:predicted DsbA family dithiol-disulfide isomerase
MSTLPRLQIDFVSDVACPWCAVGVASLGRAIESLRGEVDVQLNFRPFELNPGMGPEGEDLLDHLVGKYGGPREKFAATHATLHQRGAAVGFSFGTRERIWNTFDAHRLLHWAGLQGPAAQLALKRALLQAYHGEGRRISDPEVLAQAVAAAGLDVAQARSVLAGDTYAAEVRAEEARWQSLGIHAVPSAVVNETHLIEGGQSPEVYAEALREIAAG